MRCIVRSVIVVVLLPFFCASDRQADYYRYIAEFRSGDEKSKAAEEARKAYADAAKVAKDDLAVTHPIRLGLALNYSVFMYEVLNDPDEACKMARTAFEDKWVKHAKLLNHAETCLIPKSIQNGKGDNKTVVWRCFIMFYTIINYNYTNYTHVFFVFCFFAKVRTLLTFAFKSFPMSNQQQTAYHRQSQFVSARDISFAV